MLQMNRLAAQPGAEAADGSLAGFVVRLLGGDRWSLAGELDGATGPLLLTTAAATFTRPPVHYLECSEVSFIDVAGWNALRAVRRLYEPWTETRLCQLSRAMRRLTAIIGHP